MKDNRDPKSLDTVSIIITVHNGDKWINDCFNSIMQQTALRNQIVQIEICIYDDASTDMTSQLLESWKNCFDALNVCMITLRNENNTPKGVGYGRNRAIEVSTGHYLCFQDIDDEMFKQRIEKQYALARSHQNALIGAKFTRSPPESTCRFTRWANNLSATQVAQQIYTANGPTIVMPTWFCHRSVYNKVISGFCEAGQGTPEDLIFFYEHIDCGGEILRADEILLHYRYHPEATTFSISAATIWHIRLKHLLKHVLINVPWTEGFTIWNAGKQGRRFFRDLPETFKHQVVAFCDVDKNKIHRFYHYYDTKMRRITFTVPIVHYTNAKKPIVICMKLDITNGDFETNLGSLNLLEGVDYLLFT